MVIFWIPFNNQCQFLIYLRMVQICGQATVAISHSVSDYEIIPSIHVCGFKFQAIEHSVLIIGLIHSIAAVIYYLRNSALICSH